LRWSGVFSVVRSCVKVVSPMWYDDVTYVYDDVTYVYDDEVMC